MTVSVTALVFLIASTLYTGFQWTIRIVVYPQFTRVPLADFPTYESNHQRLVTIAVGPLFAVLGLSVLAVLVDPPAGVSRWATAPSVALVGLLLAITALLAVPLHGQLAARFDAGVHRRLLAVDTARTVVAALITVTAVVLITR